MATANTQAHYDMATITAVKSFIMHCQVLGHFINLPFRQPTKSFLMVRKVLNWMRGGDSIGVLNLFVLSKLNPL